MSVALSASDVRPGDRVEDGGSSGRIVKRVTRQGDRTRITWIDGWSDAFENDHLFDVRERDVRLGSGERVVP